MNAVSIIGVVSAFCLVCLWLLALCAEKGMHPLRRVLRGSRRLPAWEKILLSIFVSVWIAFAGLKDGDGTNGVNQVEGETNTVTQVDGTNTVWQTGDEGTNVIPGGTRFCASSLGGVRPRGSAALPVVTDDDIAVGWRVVSVSSNMLPVATFTMPTNATVWESAQACGRGWGAWHIPLDGWRFTYGDDGWTNGFAWVEGYFRSKFRSRANEIRLLSERLALCPAANWSRYNLTASRAWCIANV